MWQKQKDGGYVEEKSDLLKSDKLILPMLAHDYSKRSHDITFPCYTQPKLDGVRLLAKITSTTVEFYSRTGKLMSNLDHIIKDIQFLFKDLVDEDCLYLDGELFTFDLPFEEISGLFRKLEKDPRSKMLHFHIFDIIRTSKMDEPFSERLKSLNEYNKTIQKQKLNNLKIVTTKECTCPEDVSKIHFEYIGELYEGLILRNKTGVYKPNYRSKDLQKYKEFKDEEFEIIGGQSGEGLEKDCVIFTCKNKNDQTFAVRPRGSRELRREYLKNISEIIGKQLSVRYQNLSESGIVRFPVGIAIRDYE